MVSLERPPRQQRSAHVSRRSPCAPARNSTRGTLPTPRPRHGESPPRPRSIRVDSSAIQNSGLGFTTRLRCKQSYMGIGSDGMEYGEVVAPSVVALRVRSEGSHTYLRPLCTRWVFIRGPNPLASCSLIIQRRHLAKGLLSRIILRITKNCFRELRGMCQLPLRMFPMIHIVTRYMNPFDFSLEISVIEEL